MDRQTVYPGQILPETTLLQIAKDSMIGLAKLSAAVFGTGTMANGFAVTPTGPASLQVVVAPGELYSLTAVDGTAWSSLAADTTHSILKQGIALDSTTLTCAAPTTNGQSISYLIQASYLDLDSTPVLLPYYNSANPSQPYSGLGNNGLTQNTARKGTVVLQAKAGASAATGSQVTPSPDAGYAGLYVVTVAYGQTTITSTSISRYSAAPLLPSSILASLQGGDTIYALDTGTANSYAAAYAPAVTALKDGMTLKFKAANANTGASTFNPNGLGASPMVGSAHAALQGGEIVPASDVWVQWNSSVGSGSWVLIDSTGGALQVGTPSKSRHSVPLGQVPTETLGGAALIATQALVNAGVDDATVVTPKKMRFGFGISLGSNGYITLPSWLGGLIIQWGSGTLSPSSTTAVSFPLVFPSSFLNSVQSFQATAGNQYSLGLATTSNSGMTLWNPNAATIGCRYLAVGY